MTLSIVLDWWVWPTLVTLISFGWAYIRCAQEPDHGFMPGGAFLALFLFPMAATVSAIAWLIWALLR